jgi:hypothetical protein
VTYWYSEKRMAEIREQREEFGLYLAELITSGKPIVYLDETSFNFHMRNSRCWQRANSLVTVPLANKRLGGVTVIGAIGSGINGFIYTVAESTSTDSVYAFAKKLCATIGESNTKPYLVLDNHPAHKALKTKQLLE